MKQNKKILLIVVVAAAILAGLMLLLIFLPKGGDNSVATYDEGVNMSVSTDKNGVHQAIVYTDKNGDIENNGYGTLIDYKPAQISKIHVENNSGTLDITSTTPTDSEGKTEATVYKIKGYEDYELKSGNPDLIANAVAKLDFSKVVSTEKGDAAEFGFSKPRATVTTTYTDKTKSVIIIGDEAPQGAGTYAKFGDGDEIYLVETETVEPLMFSLNELMSLKINTAATDSNNNLPSEITLSGTRFKETIVLKAYSGEKNSASYTMEAPVKGYASAAESSLVDGAIRGLFADSVKFVNPSKKQLASVGLDKPYAEVKAVYPDITVDVISSKPDSDGNAFVMEKGGKLVYVMEQSKIPWVNTSKEKLLSEYVLNPKINSLSEVKINDGAKSYAFGLSTKNVTKTDDEGNETTETVTKVSCGGKDIDEGIFSTLYQNIALTQIADRNASKSNGTLILSVTYTYSSDQATDTVEFYSTGENRYTAVVNGEIAGHVHKSAINKIVNQVSKTADNKQVDSVF